MLRELPANRRFFSIIFCLLLSACSSVDVSTYRDSTPVFIAEEFFDGPLIASGVLKDRSGKVTRKFTADIKAYWRGGVGTLEEDFLFDDGEVTRRVWTLTPDGPNRYQATAGDVVGPGTASVSGNSMFLKYVLSVPYSGSTIDLSVDDRMYLVTPDLLLNESVLSKFGVRVAEIVLSIRRLES